MNLRTFSSLPAANYYAVSFLDKYVKDRAEARPETRLTGVSTLEMK